MPKHKPKKKTAKKKTNQGSYTKTRKPARRSTGRKY